MSCLCVLQAAAGKLSVDSLLQMSSSELQDMMRRLSSNSEDRSRLTTALSCLKSVNETGDQRTSPSVFCCFWVIHRIIHQTIFKEGYIQDFVNTSATIHTLIIWGGYCIVLDAEKNNPTYWRKLIYFHFHKLCQRPARCNLANVDFFHEWSDCVQLWIVG